MPLWNAFRNYGRKSRRVLVGRPKGFLVIDISP
jgi:hypothetical protein